MKKLSDYLPITGTGLFTAFNNPIWATAFQDSTELDTYFYLRYGDRIGNKLIDNFANDSGVVASTKLNELATLVYSINSKKWEHLFKVYNADYNPIENTDFIETISDVDTNTKNIDTSTSNRRISDIDTCSSGSATTNSNGSNNGTTTGASNKFGFNSSTAVGDTTSSGTNADTTTASSTTTSTGTGFEDSTVNETGSENSEITDNGTHVSEHRKHGNIGVTENVTMLEHEVEFWKWSFIDNVCQDICDIIALSIY